MRSPHLVRPGDPLLRWLVPPLEHEAAQHTAVEGTAVAWLGRASRRDERWVTGLGEDPGAVAMAVERVARAHPIDGVTVSESAFAHLPQDLQSPDPGHWCLWLLESGRSAPKAGGATDLSDADPRIGPLLRAHSATAHVFPGDPRVVQWAGIEVDGRLAAVGGRIREPSGAAHLVSVCTHPDYRGGGMARETCGRLIGGALDDSAPAILLQMVVGNESAARAYQAIGFKEVGRYRSGLLRHALPNLEA